MKLLNAFFTAVVLGAIPSVTAVDCGHWYSNDCLADEDIRYDEDASNIITDQAVIWGKLHGLYRSSVTAFGPTGDKIEEDFFDIVNPDTTSWPYPTANPPYEQFINLTFDSSRHYQHRYSIFPPAPAEFCNRTVPAGTLNVIPPGICGQNGISIPSEAYATSSYEKDGRIIIIPFGRTLLGLPINREGYVNIPVDESTFYASFQDDDTFFSSTTVCLDPDCDQWSTLLEVYGRTGNATSLSVSSRLVATRIENAEAFTAEIKEAYERNNIIEEQQIPAPMLEACLMTGGCPNETDFCAVDPTCSVSPYQEPAGSVKAGPIAGFVIAFFVLVIAALVLWYKHRMAQREARIRAKFARRIAETIQVAGSTRQLTPEGLAAEFKRIDTDNGGSISKEELWDFISSGKAGELSESDFNALFAAIDLDNSGTVDFMEFAAFFGKCSDDFERVKNRQSVLMLRASTKERMAVRRASTADVSASYLANLAKIEESDIDDNDEETGLEDEKRD